MAEEKNTVTLIGVGVGDKEFDIEHAERVLSNRVPPKVWKLNDDRYSYKNGKLILNTKKSTPPATT